MSLIIRNKSKSLYGMKLYFKQHIYGNRFLLKQYLKGKEMFIRNRIPRIGENTLFQKIFIETVSYCNNDCRFCPASARVGLKNRAHVMSETLYQKIIKELADLSFAGSMAFHCNNEPLLDERLESFISRARALLKDNFFYLYSNGTLINKELAQRLFGAGLNRMIISNYNDSHELLPQVKGLIDHWSDMQGEMIVDYRHTHEYLGNRAGESPNAQYILEKPLDIACFRPLTEIVVGYDGTVPLCCADGLWKVTLGNAQRSTLSEIWFSQRFKEVRTALGKGDRGCTEICSLCDNIL